MNKVDLVIVNVLINFSISHIFESLSFIPRWNMCVDNFIESIVVFDNKFLYDREVVVIMHGDDPHVLKETRSFLESY